MNVRLLSLLLLGCSLEVACQGPQEVSGAALSEQTSLDPAGLRTLPHPTEHFLDEDAEERNRLAREAWIEEMHRSAPEVDWRAIERQNGLREMARRQRTAPSVFAGSAASRWSEVGSRNQAGRMHCAMLGPDNGQGRKLYAGSALGGLWRSDPDGSNWEPLGDNLYGGVHELLVIAGDQSGDPDVVMAASNGSVYVTRDNGATWEARIPKMRSVRGVERFADNTLLAYGSAEQVGGFSDYSTLFASTDGGLSFQRRWTGAQDWDGAMWVPQTGSESSSTVYMVDQGRLKVSTDGGFNFTQRSVIDSSATKAVLTGSEDGAPQLYAALRVGGQWELHRSVDGGFSFTFLFVLLDFWESLESSPLRSNVVMYGGVEVYRSVNQGATFTKINGWGEYYGDPANKLHADVPGIHSYVDPSDPLNTEIFYISTDGGLYESKDRGQTVQNLSLVGLGVGQYYSTLTSSRDNDLILAGSQDQGYQRGDYQMSSGSGPATDFDQLISGDYGHLTSSDGTHDLVYSTYPGFILIQEFENNPVLHTASFPSGSSQLWLPPVVADPTDLNSFFFLGNELWRYTRGGGNNWNEVQHSSFNFLQGGASYLTGMAFAPSDTSRAYAVNNVGKLFYSNDGGVNWSTSSSTAPNEHYFYGNSIVVNPFNPLEAFVGGSGYSGPGVYKTTNGGVTWTAEATGLPSTLIYRLTYDHSGEDVYAAAESGAYRWRRGPGVWANILESGTPMTLFWTVEAVNDGQTIRFGTYGRGIWDYDTSCPGGWALEADPEVATVGDTLVFETCGGTPGNLALLFLTGVDGIPLFISTHVAGSFDAQGRWYIFGPIPNDPTLAAGVDLSFRVLALDNGNLIQTNDKTVRFE